MRRTLLLSLLLVGFAARGNLCPQALLDELNRRYLAVHTAMEDAFWGMRMALGAYADGSYQAAEHGYQSFVSNPEPLPAIRAALAETGVDPLVRLGLDGWRRFFEVNAIEDAAIRAQRQAVIEREVALARVIRNTPWEYFDSQNGGWTPSSENGLPLLVATNPRADLREEAFATQRRIERFLLENGFLDVVRARNQFARSLGYRNYFEYKARIVEDSSVEDIFTVLDDLELRTREVARAQVDAVVREHGPTAREPWNYAFLTTGDLTRESDPYLSVGSSVDVWGRTFHGMGVDFRGATLRLDLMDRPGKYPNGFMHGPVPSLMRDGRFEPARIHITANAVPRQVGAGATAIKTLTHEGGHAAHFANVAMPAAAYSQEHPPFSMAFAEIQSMTLDSVVQDPMWLARYARDADGNPMPDDLILRRMEQARRGLGMQVRAMLVMPYFERALYELPDSGLTVANVLRLARETELRLVPLNGATRPVLGIPHHRTADASATYHGYVLAQLGVYQTRRFFVRRDGRLVDNPAVGREMRQHYWEAGMANGLQNGVRALTREAFSAEAAIEAINRTQEQVAADTRRAIDAARALPPVAGPVRFEGTFVLSHGDEEIARYASGTDFAPFGDAFRRWVATRYR